MAKALRRSQRNKMKSRSQRRRVNKRRRVNRSRSRSQRRRVNRSRSRSQRRRVNKRSKSQRRRVKSQRRVNRSRRSVKRRKSQNSKLVMRGGDFVPPLNYNSTDAAIDSEVSKITQNSGFRMTEMPQPGYVAEYLGFVKKWKKNKQVDWLNLANKQIYLQNCIRLGNIDYPNLTVLHSFEFALTQDLKKNIRNLGRILEKLQRYDGLKDKNPNNEASGKPGNEITNEDILDHLIAQLNAVQSGKDKLVKALAKKEEARYVVAEQMQLLVRDKTMDQTMEQFRDYIEYLIKRGPIDIADVSRLSDKSENVRVAEEAFEKYISDGGQINDVEEYFKNIRNSPPHDRVGRKLTE
tara:strand:- start:318 stop:1370 length:1053 start_codon:yes stop_codon:yes gene_type:complete